MQANETFRKNVKFVIARRFTSEAEASVYAARLNETGIKSFISNANTGTLIPFSNGGIILHVAETDLNDTVELFRDLDVKSNLKVEEDYRDADLEDIAYEKSVADYENKLQRGEGKLVAIVLIILALVLAAINAFMQAKKVNNRVGLLYDTPQVDRYGSRVVPVHPFPSLPAID